jgi:hypothetical protein
MNWRAAAPHADFYVPAESSAVETVQRPGSPALVTFWCAVAIAFLTWAGLDSRFWRSDGFPAAIICLPLSIAIAGTVAAIASRARVERFGAWLALCIVGQAASLQLIQAGPAVGYQHYVRAQNLFTPQYFWATSVLIAQSAIVLWEVRTQWGRAWRFIRTLPRIRVAIGLAAFILTGAALSRSPMNYVSELVLASLIQALNLATVALAMTHAPAGLAGRARMIVQGSFADRRRRDTSGRADRAVVIAALGSVLLSGFLAYAVYQRHPHIPDELASLYQARYFADGRIAMTAPPDRLAFDVDLMIYENTRWFSLFPPGWPAVLGIGVLAGSTSLVNPILGGLNVLLLFAVIRRLVDRPLARLVAVGLALSPWHIFLSMSLMSHQLTLTCLLLSAIGALKSQESSAWAVLGGLCTGFVMLIRPLDAVIAGITLTALLGVKGRFTPASILGFVLAAVLTAAATLPYNRELTGRSTEFPLMVYFDRLYGAGSNALGFGPDRGFPNWRGIDPLMGHAAPDVFINAALNAFAVNTELLGWSGGSLFLLIYCLTRGRFDKLEWGMAGGIAGVVGFYSLYWFAGGPDFGARYWFLAIVPCLVLTVRGLEHLVRDLDSVDDGRRQLGGRAVLGAVVLTTAALLNYVPWRALDKYYHYRGARPDIRELARTEHFGRSLILIRGDRAPDYASAAVYNPIDLQADVPIYAWDVNPESRRRVLEAYKDRMVWFVDGPTVTGSTFRVVRGPVPSAQVLAE